MKLKTNRILLIILENDEKLAFSIPHDRPQHEIIPTVLRSENIKIENIKNNFFFPDTFYEAHHYQNYFDVNTKRLDEKLIATDFKIEEIKKQRSGFFSTLDIEFLKALEGESKDQTNHISKIKNYFRDLPNLVESFCKNLSVDEITKFNAFNNVFYVNVIHKGKGYVSAPVITISPPQLSGFPMKAIGTVKDGKINEIIVTQTGSGYIKKPSVIISNPENAGEVAIATASDIENNVL